MNRPKSTTRRTRQDRAGASRPVKGRSPARLSPVQSFPWPEGLASVEPAKRSFTVALIASLVLHAFVLSIRFRFPEIDPNRSRDSQLEVVLVNSRSATRPVEPQARAQTNLDGGGNTDENRIAKTPLPPQRHQSEGDQLVAAQRRVQEMEAKQQALLTQVEQAKTAPSQDERTNREPEPPSPQQGADLAQTALAMARMEAQIARQVEEYNKRPRKKFVGARTVEAVEAQYVEDWRQKVERVGNLNYPEAAKGKLYGSLVLSVAIRADGEVDSIEVSRPSGHRLLDEAARRIVEMAAPFGSFPPRLRQNVDILVISRTWSFTSANRLQSD
jgi:protein TonB